MVADVITAEAYPHLRDEVGELLSNGLAIVNRYSLLFHSNSYPGQIIGQSDYHYVLRAVQERIDRQRRERLRTKMLTQQKGTAVPHSLRRSG